MIDISFNSLQKRLCKLTDVDKNLLRKYNDMEELPQKQFEQYEYHILDCKKCHVEVRSTWTFCPSCGHDLPITDDNKVNECEELKNV